MAATGGVLGGKRLPCGKTAYVVLGRGAFGVFKLGVHKSASRLPDEDEWNKGSVAIKRTRRKVLDLRDEPNIRSYRVFWNSTYCQEFKKLIRLRQDGLLATLVLNLHESYMSGCEFYILQGIAVPVVQTISRSALEFVHHRGVVHRDLKLQNVMFRQHDVFWTLKTIEFRMAKSTNNKGLCGSTGYIAAVCSPQD